MSRTGERGGRRGAAALLLGLGLLLAGCPAWFAEPPPLPTPEGPAISGPMGPVAGERQSFFSVPEGDAGGGVRVDRRAPAAASTGLLMALGALLWGWALRRRGPPSPLAPPLPADPQAERRWALASPVVFALAAVGFTWPAAIAGADWLVGREFDLPGTVWFLGAAPRVLWAPHDLLTGFPEGADYNRADSYVWLLLGWALDGLLRPVQLNNLLQIVGIASSGWAAEWCARRLGARAPWSFIAGAGFAFAGAASTALLEGHSYFTLDPFLPLGLGALVAGCRPEGRAWHGLAFGLCWSAALWSTAYLGLCATLIGAVVGIDALRGGSLPARVVAAAAAVILPVGGLYTWRFLAGGVGLTPTAELTDTWEQRVAFAARGSAEALSFMPPTPELDTFLHASSLYPLAPVLLLALASPWVLRGWGWGRRIGALTAVAFVCSLGPSFRIGVLEKFTLSPLAALYLIPAFGAMRFPVRFGWVMHLGLGLLAAVTLSRLADQPALRRPGWGRRGLHLIWPMLLLDIGVVLGMPGRQGRLSASTPSAYSAGGPGAVLDVYPRLSLAQDDLNAWTQALSCVHQGTHGRAIADNCATRFVGDSPRFARQARLLEALSVAPLQPAQLQAQGFDSIALHADLFPRAEREVIERRLRAVDASPELSLDGGERLVLYDLRGAGPDPAAPRAGEPPAPPAR